MGTLYKTCPEPKENHRSHLPSEIWAAQKEAEAAKWQPMKQ